MFCLVVSPEGNWKMSVRPLFLMLLIFLPVHFTLLPVQGEVNSKAEAGKSSLEFQGKGQVIIPKLRYDGDHPITLEAWAKPEARDDNYIRASVVANLQLAGVGIHYSGGHWMVHFNEGRKSNAGYASVVSDAEAEHDKPVHLAAVFDGKNVLLFVNGKKQESVNETTLKHVASPHDFMIGADPNGTGLPHQFFKGAIDEVRISKVARYSENFEPAPRFKPDKDTLVLYHFDEGTGNVAHDESGNQYDGKIKNAAWVKQIIPEP